jgi:restriction system protein
MAEITVRRTGELLRGVLQVLRDQPDGLPASEVFKRLESEVPPTEFEASDYPNRPGVRRYEKIVRFMTINAVKAGWLTKSRGTWSATDEGRRALDAFLDPEQFMREANRLYRAWRRDQPDEPEAGEVDGAPPPRVTIEEAEEAAWKEIEKYLQAIDPYDFQNLVAALLRAMGYHVAWVSPPGPDRGLDVLAFTDPLGATGPRIKAQVKRLSSTKVDVNGIRSFMATLGSQDVGIFISLGGFTTEAEREARSQENRRLTLVEAERLFSLWVEHYEQIGEEDRQLLPLRPVYYLALPE